MEDSLDDKAALKLQFNKRRVKQVVVGRVLFSSFSDPFPRSS
jgi:hypothetical protein